MRGKKIKIKTLGFECQPATSSLCPKITSAGSGSKKYLNV
jgi:hypothetical protein